MFNVYIYIYIYYFRFSCEQRISITKISDISQAIKTIYFFSTFNIF
jgi:hypothetical protein